MSLNANREEWGKLVCLWPFIPSWEKEQRAKLWKGGSCFSEIRTCNVRNSCWVVNLAMSLLCSRLGHGRPNAQQAGWGSRVIWGHELSWPAWLHPRAAVPGSHRTEAQLSHAGTSSFPLLAQLTLWRMSWGTSLKAVSRKFFGICAHTGSLLLPRPQWCAPGAGGFNKWK